jgi:hypothetical protein
VGEPPSDRKKAEVRKGVPYAGELTIGAEGPRLASVYWRELNVLYEVTVYPLLFGQYLLCTGRRDRDYWETGYYYPDFSSAMSAADDWDGKADPGHGWIKHVSMDARRKIEDEF